MGKPFLHEIKRLFVPFATVSTGLLFTTFRKAKAATLTDIVFQKRGALTHNYTGQVIGSPLLDAPRSLFHNLEYITGKIIDGLDWLNNLPVSLPKLTADLLTAIYHFISKIVLETPLFIFNNPYLKNTSLTFAVLSLSIVTILTIFESIMQILNKKHTDFRTILKRWFFAVCITGFMPFAFEEGFKYINKLSDAITHIGGINGGNANGFIHMKKMGFFDTLFLCLFDLTAISMLIPICLQAGKRWWDLLCLCCISPLALTANVFDRHKHYFDTWWDKVKSLSLVQIVYSVFILLMGVFIFTTQSIHGGAFTLICKTVLVLGGLTRLANPPSFITRLTGSKEDIFDEYDKTKNTLTNIWDTLTLRNLRPTQFIKNKLAIVKERKLKLKYGMRHVDLDSIELGLRKKHGRRFVKDLM